MYRIIRLFFFCLFGFCVLKISAQELPPIQVFTSEDYNAENQNWSISQADDKTVYIANNEGLLEYNGAAWTLYPSPNGSVMRSVKVVGDRIYSGNYMEFGFWQKSEIGLLNYTSLSNGSNIELIEDEQFWSIVEFDDFILFRSLNRIYIYNTDDETFRVINSNYTITNISKANGSLYFQRLNDGLYKLENGKDVLISNNDIVKNKVIVGVFPIEDGLNIQTQDEGMYQFKNSIFTRPNGFDNNALNEFSVYTSIMLNDGTYALGTISNGVVHISSDGQIKYQISQNEGLSNNTVLSLFEDLDGNIWLGLDNGIDCLNINSPFKIFNDDEGKLGTVHASAVFNGNLYLGTNQGLFFKNLNSKNDFSFIEGTQGQVWSLFEYQDTLFCGHNFGTFIINNTNAVKISNIQGTWGLRPIENRPNLLLQGNYNGLHILEKKNNTWSFRNKIEGFDISSRFFELADQDHILVSHEYKGIFNIKVNSDFTEIVNVVEDTLHKGHDSGLLKYNGEVLYAYNKGVFKYENLTNTLVRDSILSAIYNTDTYISGKLVADRSSHKLWGFSKTALKYITPGKLSSKPEINEIEISHSQRNTKVNYENIIPLNNENYLLGTSSGYMVLDLKQKNEVKYSVKINTITNGSLEHTDQLVNQSVEGDFKSAYNNFEFSFSVPGFDKFSVTKYQYQLEGIYDDWSSWSTSSKENFKNLPFGDYIFRVRAKVGEHVSENIESYTFTINRPWYLSNLALLLYGVAIMLFSFSMHIFYKTYYRKQREKILLKTQRELELKELENQQQLMRFKNETLEQDVKSKNRELAVSTMSLIKKNEFLNTIKEELKKAEGNQDVNKVIKIIDKNINNTNDWKLFEEAFNNADKDFLKKVKSKHESLTPNDLKLCAYLRLNLSSKEIAPLLNISPRSVEVKRYRLRKKMNLPHEASLTNYILEI